MSLPEETLDIQTPENVAFGYQVAGIGSRFLATLLDTFLIVILQVVVLLRCCEPGGSNRVTVSGRL